MTKQQATIIEQQRERIAQLEAEAADWHKQYEHVWKDRQEAFKEIRALQFALDHSTAERQVMAMEVKRLTIVTEGQAEDLAQADSDRKVLYQIWKEAEAAYTAERLKNADLQTAFNLQKEIARRHALRADQAIRNLEEIGWQFAIANFVATEPEGADNRSEAE